MRSVKVLLQMCRLCEAALMLALCLDLCDCQAAAKSTPTLTDSHRDLVVLSRTTS